MNMIAKGEEAQRNWRARHLEDDAVYQRLDMLTPIRATKGSTRTTVSGRDGAVQMQSRVVDFIIDVSYLTSYGEPKVGDRILHAGNIYEVKITLDGVRAWAWSGRDNKSYRIHTTQVTNELPANNIPLPPGP